MTDEKKKKRTTKSPEADEPMSKGREADVSATKEPVADGSTVNGSTGNGPAKKGPSAPEKKTEEITADGTTVKGQKAGNISKEEKDRETGTDDSPEPGTRNLEPAAGDAAVAADASPHPFEALLDEYPLREPSEDPVWSVRIVKGWMYFLAFNFAWIFLFLILGIFYE